MKVTAEQVAKHAGEVADVVSLIAGIAGRGEKIDDVARAIALAFQALVERLQGSGINLDVDHRIEALRKHLGENDADAESAVDAKFPTGDE